MPRVTDSVLSAEERVAKMRDEAARIERERAEAEAKQNAHRAAQQVEARKIEEDDLKKTALISGEETREQLLDRIRQMREDKPPEPPPPVGHRTPRMQEEYEAEVAMGRAMVAKAEAEMERNREIKRKIEAEERERQGTMEPVYHPNPSQTEQYPTTGGTLGKPAAKK